MHGLITYEKVRQLGEIRYICRFSSPYVQTCLYTVFTNDVSTKHSGRVLAIDPLDFIEEFYSHSCLLDLIFVAKYIKLR
jgi:hypothetical protein